MNINIPGIDVEKAIKNAGSEELLIELLGDVYKLMDDKIASVKSNLASNNISNYTVEVHSLKTTCRMIGAMELGEDFFMLEKLGKDNDVEQIIALTPGVLDTFKGLKPYLEPFALNSLVPQKSFDKEALSNNLNMLITAVNDFDLGRAEDAVKQLLSYKCDEALSTQIKDLDKLVSNLDYDEAKALAIEIKSTL
jgi:HPt (histidine-containing phosphotransfer) domain-containing protein